jgi:F0F1-type ATP synthase assembly protein I
VSQAPIFNKLKNSRDSGAGYDLVANILVGLGLVWVARYFWPGLPKSLYGLGVVLGAISGFYQLFKSQPKAGPPKHLAPPDDDAKPLL